MKRAVLLLAFISCALAFSPDLCEDNCFQLNKEGETYLKVCDDPTFEICPGVVGEEAVDLCQVYAALNEGGRFGASFFLSPEPVDESKPFIGVFEPEKQFLFGTHETMDTLSGGYLTTITAQSPAGSGPNRASFLSDVRFRRLEGDDSVLGVIIDIVLFLIAQFNNKREELTEEQQELIQEKLSELEKLSSQGFGGAGGLPTSVLGDIIKYVKEHADDINEKRDQILSIPFLNHGKCELRRKAGSSYSLFSLATANDGVTCGARGYDYAGFTQSQTEFHIETSLIPTVEQELDVFKNESFCWLTGVSAATIGTGRSASCSIQACSGDPEKLCLAADALTDTAIPFLRLFEFPTIAECSAECLTMSPVLPLFEEALAEIGSMENHLSDYSVSSTSGPSSVDMGSVENNICYFTRQYHAEHSDAGDCRIRDQIGSLLTVNPFVALAPTFPFVGCLPFSGSSTECTITPSSGNWILSAVGVSGDVECTAQCVDTTAFSYKFAA